MLVAITALASVGFPAFPTVAHGIVNPVAKQAVPAYEEAPCVAIFNLSDDEDQCTEPPSWA